jgi:hypothetical protein
MPDLKQRFEELGHNEPAHPPVRDRLDSGRRALRRRRTAAGLATLAAVVVVGGGAWALGGGENRADPGPGYASEPTTSPSAATVPIKIPVGSNEDVAEAGGEGVFYDQLTGELKRAAGANVTRLVPEPIPTKAQKSIAVEVDYQGETRWLYIYWSPGSGGGGFDPIHEGETFDDWVASLDPDRLQDSFGYGVATAIPVEPDQDADKSR